MRLLCTLLFAIVPCPVQAATCASWTGVVLEIHDDDILRVALSGIAKARIAVRLYRIDAPEKGQPHGSEAAAALAMANTKAVGLSNSPCSAPASAVRAY